MGVNDNIFVILLHPLLGALGGAISYLQDKDKKSVKLFRLAVRILSASFTALMLGFFALYANIPLYLSFVIAGLGGTGGPEVPKMLFNAALRAAHLPEIKKSDT